MTPDEVVAWQHAMAEHYLHDIEIDASRRGQGLGTALLAAIERATTEAGVGHLEMRKALPPQG